MRTSAIYRKYRTATLMITHTIPIATRTRKINTHNGTEYEKSSIATTAHNPDKRYKHYQKNHSTFTLAPNL